MSDQKQSPTEAERAAYFKRIHEEHAARVADPKLMLDFMNLGCESDPYITLDAAKGMTNTDRIEVFEINWHLFDPCVYKVEEMRYIESLNRPIKDGKYPSFGMVRVYPNIGCRGTVFYLQVRSYFDHEVAYPFVLKREVDTIISSLKS